MKTKVRIEIVKIKVSIVREFDTGEDHEDLFAGVKDPVDYALDMFAEDIDYLVKYNEVRTNARVEVDK